MKENKNPFFKSFLAFLVAVLFFFFSLLLPSFAYNLDELHDLDYRYISEAKAYGKPKERSLEYWVEVLFYHYWGPNGWEYGQWFISQAIKMTISPTDLFWTGKYNEDGLPELRHSDGDIVWWSWNQPFYNKTAEGPDSWGLYWSWMEYALRDPFAKKEVWLDPLFFLSPYHEILVGIECGNINERRGGPPRTPKVFGYKWHDLDGDGKWDPGEPPLSGWKIELYYGDGATPVLNNQGKQLVATTNDEGYYEFDLKYRKTAELYDYDKYFKLKEELKPGWKNSYSPPAFYISLNEASKGFVFGPYYFGNYQLGKKRGHKFHDRDKNGKRNFLPELGIWEEYLPGWRINLFKLQGEREVLVDSTQTDSQGRYEFTNLDFGTYRVREVLKEGWVQTTPTSPNYYQFTINRSGQIEENNDFGNFKLGKKGGFKFLDQDGDGKYEPAEGDSPMNGVTIVLFSLDKEGKETTLATTLTGLPPNPPGRYLFENLDLGTYRVKEIPPSGFLQTCPAIEQDTTEVLGGILAPLYYQFTIKYSGFEDLNNDFGNWEIPSLGKTKGYWMRVYVSDYDKDRKPPSSDSDLYTDYLSRIEYLTYINNQSAVFGEGEVLDELKPQDVYPILKTEKTGQETTQGAFLNLESQFLATWLNLAAGYLSPERLVYLERIPQERIPIPKDELYEMFGGKVVPISQIIRVVEEAIILSLQSNFSQGWSRHYYTASLEVFTFINEAESTQGAPFRAPLDP